MTSQENFNNLTKGTFEGLFCIIKKDPDFQEKHEAFTVNQTFMGFGGNNVKSIDTPIDTAFEIYISEEFEKMMNIMFCGEGSTYHTQIAKTYIAHFIDDMERALRSRFDFMVANYKCNIIMHFIHLVHQSTGVYIPEDIFTTSIDNPYSFQGTFSNIMDYISLCSERKNRNWLHEDDDINQGSSLIDSLTPTDIDIISDDIISNMAVSINERLFAELSAAFRSELYKQPSGKIEEANLTTVLEKRDQFNIVATEILSNAINNCVSVLLLELSNVCYDVFIVMDRKIYINKNFKDLI